MEINYNQCELDLKNAIKVVENAQRELLGRDHKIDTLTASLTAANEAKEIISEDLRLSRAEKSFKDVMFYRPPSGIPILAKSNRGEVKLVKLIEGKYFIGDTWWKAQVEKWMKIPS